MRIKLKRSVRLLPPESSGDIEMQTRPGKRRSISEIVNLAPWLIGNPSPAGLRSTALLPRSAETDAFWQAFRRYAGLDHDNYMVGSFGDSPEMATELAHLVIAGVKRVTASLARDYGEGREPTPRPCDFVVVFDGKGRPRFIWRTTEVTIKPLSQVDEAFAWEEGRGPHARLVARCPSPLFRSASEA